VVDKGMKIRLSRRGLIITGGAVVLLLGALYRFAPDMDWLTSPSSEKEIRIKQIRKYQEAIREKAPLEARKVALAKSLAEVEEGLLTGKTSALAAVEIQNILDGIAKKTKGDIKTLRVLKAEEIQKEPYVMVPVEFTLNSTIRQLNEILYLIETSQKYLVIQQMRIDVARARGSSAAIQSQITVAGIMRKEGG
jgi:hypothetical protein